LIPFLLRTLRQAAWAPILVFGLHSISASSLDLYAAWPPLDIPMHFFGGMAIAFFFSRAYRVAEEMDFLGRPSAILFPVAVFALTCTAAVFWEFAEFLSDRFFNTQMQDGLEDTLFDMFLGIVGGIALLVPALASSRRMVPESRLG
jgi:hypothetical protein